MSIRLTQGTKEIVPVTVFDRTGAITDLSGTTPKFDVEYDNDTTLYLNQTATAIGMVIYCLVDLSAGGPGGLITPQRLRLFVEFTITGPPAQAPRLGPVELRVTDEP